MSVVNLFDRVEFERWWNQAQHTLQSAERDAHEGDFAWACFKAQQAGEYALKGLLRGFGKRLAGHSVNRLLGELAALGLKPSPELVRAGKALDFFYIPTRYPDAFPSGSPHEYFSEETAKEALHHARQVLDWTLEVAREAGA